MQVSVETTSGLERRLTVEVPAERIDSEVEKRLKDAAKTIRLDGFRKGKIPVKVVKQRFGKGVRQEVTGEVVSKSFYEAVSQEKLRPAGQPSFEPLKGDEGDNLEYVAIFEVYPEFEISDLSVIEVVKPTSEVTDADVEKMIEVLRDQQASWSVVEREAADSDRVNIDFVGTKDGEVFEDGTSEGFDLELGSGEMIPGFEDAVVGMSAGEEKTIDLTFPEDYHEEELKVVPVQFAVTLNTVSEKQLPELNEEFFSVFGVREDSIDKFRAEVRNNMERELKNAINNKVKTRVMEQLADLHEFDLPKSLVDSEIVALKQKLFQQYGQGAENLDVSMLPDDMFTDQAGKRVKLGLIISGVITSSDIQVDSDRVRAQIEEIASTYEQPDQVIEYYYSQENMLDGVQSAVLEEQVVEHILESAKVTEEQVSYEDALKPDAPVAEAEEEAETTPEEGAAEV